MSTQPVKPFDTEEERQGRIAEMEADYGPAWDDESRPGSFGCHELLDRTNLVANNLEEWILSHPACVQNAEWYALAERAASALRELYQRIGADHLERHPDDPERKRVLPATAVLPAAAAPAKHLEAERDADEKRG